MILRLAYVVWRKVIFLVLYVCLSVQMEDPQVTTNDDVTGPICWNLFTCNPPSPQAPSHRPPYSSYHMDLFKISHLGPSVPLPHGNLKIFPLAWYVCSEYVNSSLQFLRENGPSWSCPAGPQQGTLVRCLRKYHALLPYQIGLAPNQYFAFTCKHYPTPIRPIRPFCLVHGYFQLIPCQFHSLCT